MGEVNAEIVLDGAAEERVEWHTQSLGFNIPQRHVDGRKARHQSRAVAPARGHIVHAIPMRLRAGRIRPTYSGSSQRSTASATSVRLSSVASPSPVMPASVCTSTNIRSRQRTVTLWISKPVILTFPSGAAA